MLNLCYQQKSARAQNIAHLKLVARVVSIVLLVESCFGLGEVGLGPCNVIVVAVVVLVTVFWEDIPVLRRIRWKEL